MVILRVVIVRVVIMRVLVRPGAGTGSVARDRGRRTS